MKMQKTMVIDGFRVKVNVIEMTGTALTWCVKFNGYHVCYEDALTADKALDQAIKYARQLPPTRQTWKSIA